MKKLVICGLIALFLSACAEKEAHFISDALYRERVSKQFADRKEMAKNRDEALFGVFKQNLSTEQQEALMFLYAYMPLNDLADYDGEFFLKQVNTALATREAFTWGKTIPEDIFRHFVLPYRVNNENLDTARMVFFNELKTRLAGMSMYDAALEVNHWCHEKVTYKPTDIRTSAPLATIRTAWGRCGEESTFTVTALRAAGIPARQCYTPRWAHTDDNHAWVEVWVDGKWYYLGACEPEAELNMAWFSAPVKRAMMVHTNVFGEYNGAEETILKTHIYSKINLLANYAPTKELVVKVSNEKGEPVNNARVEFKLYNYAEFYSIASKNTNSEGITKLTTGLGDLLIWATDGEKFGYTRIEADAKYSVNIILDKKQGDEYPEETYMLPPIPLKKEEASSEREFENNRRLKLEDSIRGAYEATFPQRKDSDMLAEKEGLDKDKVWNAMSKSFGNWKEIAAFIEGNASNEYLFDMLEIVGDKDLRDTPADIFTDHIENAENKNNYPRDVFVSSVLCPRISNEMILPWRSFLQNELPTHARENVNVITDWVQKNIAINTTDSYYNCPITPIGVYNLRVADKASRNIFFVAVCRASGIAARIDAATATPQVYENGEWKNVVFEANNDANNNTGTLVLNNSARNTLKSEYFTNYTLTPKYYTNYTLARYINGDFVTLDYENSPLIAKFPVVLKLDEGYYRLTTGNRDNAGCAFMRIDYFNLPPQQITEVDVFIVPITQSSVQLVGSVSLQHNLKKLDDNSNLNLEKLAQSGNMLLLVFLDPTREPSRHVMNDIPKQREMFEKRGVNVVFVSPDDKAYDLNPANYKDLPKQSIFAVDEGRKVMNALFADLEREFIGDYPVLMLIKPNADVIYMWQGYRIGIADDLAKAINKDLVEAMIKDKELSTMITPIMDEQ